MTREKNQITIDDSENCCLSQSKDGQTLFLAWKSVPGLLVQDFAEGVSKLAMQCGIRQPKYAVIDAQKLDPTSPAVAWLRGEGTDANGDNYQTWWMRDIVSAYNDAGIVSLAVATGDPSAPGELQETPPGVNFKIAYFPELSAATTWRPEAMRQLEPSTNAPANLKGLRVAVTGGTSGLGLEFVRHFVQAGAKVVFIARTQSRVEEVVAETGAQGLIGDIGAKEGIYPLAMQTTALLGGLDVLINNASSLGPTPLRPLANTECEHLEDVLGVNLLGPFRFTNAVYGALAESARNRGTAAVVNISSDAGVSAYPNWGAYGISKAALAHLSSIWDEESKPFGIRFLSIDPGDMNTSLHFAAIPDADPNELKHPAESALKIAAQICDELSLAGAVR